MTDYRNRARNIQDKMCHFRTREIANISWNIREIENYHGTLAEDLKDLESIIKVSIGQRVVNIKFES